MMLAAGSVMLMIAVVYAISFGHPQEFQARRTAADIVALLDYTQVLDTFNSTAIANNLTAYTPSNMRLGMNISRYTTAGTFDSSIAVMYEMNGTFSAGRWWFVSFADKTVDAFYIVDYRVTLK